MNWALSLYGIASVAFGLWYGYEIAEGEYIASKKWGLTTPNFSMVLLFLFGFVLGGALWPVIAILMFWDFLGEVGKKRERSKRSC